MHVSTPIMIAVAFSVVGIAWLVTSPLRKVHQLQYQRVLLMLLMTCAIGAIVGLSLNSSNVLVDWLLAIGFAVAAFHMLGFWRSRTKR